MSRLPILPSVSEILRLYEVKALKHLSQNFLVDKRITDKFVKAAGRIEGGEVCEVGPGAGSITRSILEKNPSQVFLIEKDERFKPLLEDLKSASPVPIHTAYSDVRNFDMSKMFSESLKTDWQSDSPNIHLIGNLPFSVSTYLIIQWLRDISLKKSAWSYGRVKMTLSFQDDVAMRIAANERSRMKSRLTIMCQNWCSTNYKFMIKAGSFVPKPIVHVGVLQFEPLKEPKINYDFELVEKVLNRVFNTKNKYLKSATKSLFPIELRDTLCKELIDRSQVPESARPVFLTMSEWHAIIEAYKYICDRDPRLYNYDPRENRRTRENSWKTEEESVKEAEASV